MEPTSPATPFHNNSVYFVEVDKVQPNPFQPRIEFDKAQLESLAESIRMYGVLQPMTVTRKEEYDDDGGMSVHYELIAGERRLRASKLAGLREVPVIIRSSEQSDREKLEIAIIENLQREDLNPVDRAKAFDQLVKQFGLKHGEVGKKVGRSREYVSNSIRLLQLPEHIQQAITVGKIMEGHGRILLTLGDRPEEQETLFKEIMLKGLTVRQSDKITRRVAHDKVRKASRAIDPHIVEVEEEMSQTLGTRVHIEQKGTGGKIQIDYFSPEDLHHIMKFLQEKNAGDHTATQENSVQNDQSPTRMMDQHVAQAGGLQAAVGMNLAAQEEREPEDVPVTEAVQKEVQVNEPIHQVEQKEVQSQQMSYAQPEPHETTHDMVTQHVHAQKQEVPHVSGQQIEQRQTPVEPVVTQTIQQQLATPSPSQNDVQNIQTPQQPESQPQTQPQAPQVPHFGAEDDSENDLYSVM